MNIKRKEAAVKKYRPMLNQGVTVEELGNLLAQDEKNYTLEEQNELRQAIIGDESEKPAAQTPPAPPAPKAKKSEVVGFEEWRCEVKVSGEGNNVRKEVEKVKRLRANVKITDEEAETLNRGAKDSPRTDYVIMYFKPE
jgi:hypothetical protein